MTEKETRAELFASLLPLSEIIPEMRVGQLFSALGELRTDLHGRGLWDASDGELLEAARRYRRDFEATAASPARSKDDPATPLLSR